MTEALRGTAKATLNEARSWVGSRVDDIYGANVGRLEGIWGDEDTGEARWLLIREGWFGTTHKLIPFSDATSGAGHVWIPYERDVVRHAPAVAPNAPPTPNLESVLFAHYKARTPGGGEATFEPQAMGAAAAPLPQDPAARRQPPAASAQRPAPTQRGPVPPPRPQDGAPADHPTPTSRPPRTVRPWSGGPAAQPQRPPTQAPRQPAPSPQAARRERGSERAAASAGVGARLGIQDLDGKDVTLEVTGTVRFTGSVRRVDPRGGAS